jgi:Polyketide cyclase / dehydrase and lipid transport
VRPVTVSVTVPQAREEVYELIAVLGAHEAFTDHFLVDWETSGPRSGVGARAHMRVKKPGRPDWLDVQVVAVEPPRMTAEETVSVRRRRRTRGTYFLEELPGGGTRISFELAWLEAPLSERLAAPLVRRMMRRNNERSLRRLAEQLGARPKTEGGKE